MQEETVLCPLQPRPTPHNAAVQENGLDSQTTIVCNIISLGKRGPTGDLLTFDGRMYSFLHFSPPAPGGTQTGAFPAGATSEVLHPTPPPHTHPRAGPHTVPRPGEGARQTGTLLHQGLGKQFRYLYQEPQTYSSLGIPLPRI